MNKSNVYAKKSIILLTALILALSTLVFCNVKNVYAQDGYSVKFVVDGETTEYFYDVGEEIIKPENPFKKGFRFIGWDKEIPEFMGEENLIFTALFEEDNVLPKATIKYFTTERGTIIAYLVDPSEEIIFGEDGGIYEFTDNGSYEFVITDMAGNKAKLMAFCYDVDIEYVSIFAPIAIAALSAVVITILLCSYFFLLRPKIKAERVEFERQEQARLEKEKEVERTALLLAEGKEKAKRKRKPKLQAEEKQPVEKQENTDK